jgi:thymidylate synthase (FAD)
MKTTAAKIENQGVFAILASDLRLYVLSRPLFDSREFSSFLENEGTGWKQTSKATDAENIAEVAGRICYMSFGSMQSPRSNHEYIQNLIFQEHESVLEHVSWTFLLTGVSRAFSHQMIRHRIGFSFSQLSQQYYDESMAKFVVPEEMKSDPAAMEAWLHLIEEVRRQYSSISKALERTNKCGPGSSKEMRRAIRSAARSVLPNATETKIIFSANARALRHFLTLRGAIIGDREMRRVAALIYARMLDEAPALVCDFELTKLEDGYPLITRKEK